MEPRARVSVWPGRRRLPGIVAPDSWGARGAVRRLTRRSAGATHIVQTLGGPFRALDIPHGRFESRSATAIRATSIPLMLTGACSPGPKSTRCRYWPAPSSGSA